MYYVYMRLWLHMRNDNYDSIICILMIKIFLYVFENMDVMDWCGGGCDVTSGTLEQSVTKVVPPYRIHP